MRKQASWLVGLVMLISAGTPDAAASGVPAMAGFGPVGAVADEPAEPSPSELVGFDTCDAFLDHLKSEALERVGPYGFGGGGRRFAAVEEAAEADSGGQRAALTDPTAGVDYSTTNVQEVGVDEPDIVKTDGRRILALAQGVLYYIDVSSGAPVLVSSRDLWPWNQLRSGWGALNQQLFLNGDTALLMMSGYQHKPGQGRGEITLLVQIDLSEPAVLRVMRSLSVEGRFVSARLVGDRVSLVLSSTNRMDLEFVYPASGSESAGKRAERANRMAIEESTLEHWVPGYELKLRNSRASTEGALIDCSSTYAPQEFSGFGLLSVLTFDITEGIDVGSVATVMSGATPCMRRPTACTWRTNGGSIGPGSTRTTSKGSPPISTGSTSAGLMEPFTRRAGPLTASCSTSSPCRSTTATCGWPRPTCRPGGGVKTGLRRAA